MKYKKSLLCFIFLFYFSNLTASEYGCPRHYSLRRNCGIGMTAALITTLCYFVATKWPSPSKESGMINPPISPNNSFSLHTNSNQKELVIQNYKPEKTSQKNKNEKKRTQSAHLASFKQSLNQTINSKKNQKNNSRNFMQRWNGTRKNKQKSFDHNKK